MKFLNTKNLFISTGEDYETLTFNIMANDALDLNVNDFLESIAGQVASIAKQIKASGIDNTKKYLIVFNTDLEDLEDLKQVSSVLGSMLFKSQIKKKRKSQLAFAQLEFLGDIAITELTLGDLLKNKSKIKFINYAVSTIDKKYTFYMLGEKIGDEEVGEN